MGPGLVATSPGVLPFIMAKDPPGSQPTPVPPTVDSSGMPKPGAIEPSTTITAPISAGSNSGQSQTIEGEEARLKRLQAEQAGQAAVDSLKDPVLPGYAINPLTGEEIGKPPPAPAEPPPAPIPADTVVPIGKFATIPAGQIPGMKQVEGGVVPEAPKAAEPTYTLSAQKDANAMAAAMLAERQAKASAERQAQEERLRQEGIDQWQARVKELEADYQKARKSVVEPEKRSIFAEVLRALSIGAGGYAAGILGGPNYAAQILEASDKAEFDRKKLELETAAEKLKEAGARPEQINKLYDNAMAKLTAKQNVETAELQAKAKALLAKFPKEQAEAQKVIAEAQSKQADRAAQYAKGVGDRNVTSGTFTPAATQTTVIPGADKLKGAGGGPSMDDIAKVEGQKLSKKGFDRLDELLSNPKVWKEWQQANIEQQKVAAREKAGIGKLDALGQGVGLSPLTMDQRLKTKEARELNALLVQPLMGQTRIVDPDGVVSEGARTYAGTTMNLNSASADEFRAFTNKFREKATSQLKQMEANLEAKKAHAAPLNQSRQEQPATRNLIGNELKKLTQKEQERYAEAKRMTIDPNNPNREKALNAVRALEAKARGGE